MLDKVEKHICFWKSSSCVCAKLNNMALKVDGLSSMEPSPVVLQPLCSVRTINIDNSLGDSDSDDDLNLSSGDAAYKSAHGRLLGLNGKKVVYHIELQYFNPFIPADKISSFLPNSVDPDEMAHNKLFHQNLHCHFLTSWKKTCIVFTPLNPPYIQ